MKIGLIGGSGLDDPKILEKPRIIDLKTKFGKTHSPITSGIISNSEVFLVARHGKNHLIPPSQVNYRANILSLKKLGCDFIIATTAVGSLREKIKPGDLVLPDSFLDFTKLRNNTFHENEVVHTEMSEPFDLKLRENISREAKSLGLKHHSSATVVTIEGPRFSTKAESRMFRMWGADIINMTTCPEVILANELEIPYQSIAISTDYDCWKENEEPVSFGMVMKRMDQNAKKVKNLLINVIKSQ